MKSRFGSRKLHYIMKLSILLMTVALLAAMAGCPGGYNPPPSQDLEIRTWYDLDDVRDNLEGHHILMNDLNSTTPGYAELAGLTANGGRGWEPIGIYYSEESHWCFTGTFDGQGHEIRDLFVNHPDADNFWCAGLFTSVEQYAVIKDIGVVNASVAGVAVAGGLVGINDGTVSNCYFTGSVTGTSQVGGLVGDNYGTLSNSYAAGNVAGGEWDAGGLVGANSGTVSDCYSTGSVSGSEYVGGLVGHNWRDVNNSHYNYDDVLINGENVITIGALFDDDFEEWLANDKSLDVSERLSQEDGYYLISDISDFKQLLAVGQNASLEFRLTNDLDLAAEPNFYIPYLAGEFDGNGHKISNLSFNFGFVSYVGLFGYLASGGTAHQVGAENVNITACRDVGGLVGFNMGAVGNSSSSGSVTGKYSVGGLAGHVWEGDVSNSYSTGGVIGSMQYVGGLVGQMWEGSVSNSSFTGSVTGVEYVGGLVGYHYYYSSVSNSSSAGSITGDWHVGGLVGDSSMGSTIRDSYFSGGVTGKYSVGGLVGSSSDDCSVSNSYSTGSVTGNRNVGGLVGHSHGTVSDCHANSTVIGIGDSVGGLMGTNGGSVSNSYAAGSVAGNGYVGGLVGWNPGPVSNSYSTGSVTGNSSVGGLVGGSADTVSNSFWDMETSGQATSAGGVGKNTTEMQDTATFSGAGWNITAVALNGTDPAYVWNIVNNVTYPFLSWQP